MWSSGSSFWLKRAGMSPIGICLLPAIFATSTSHGSRTSSSVTLFPESRIDFSSSVAISQSMNLLSYPLWPAALHIGCDPFLCVGGFHQFVEIDLLGASQALVEVNRIPGVERFLGDRNCDRTQLRDSLQTFCDQSFRIVSEAVHQSGFQCF